MQEPPSILTPPPGPRSREIAMRLSDVECPAFDARRKTREETSGAEQAPIAYARAKGSNVWDADGNRYVDFVAGFGACALGHAPAAIDRVVREQMDSLWLALGDVYGSDAKLRACDAISALYPERGARVMLGTSGADAVTAALKTCVLATGKAGVMAFTGAYHGLSHGPLAACGLHPSFREPFRAQLGEHVVFAPYPNADDALDATLSAVVRAFQEREIGAVLVEPILGRGGCVVPPRGFLTNLREICDKNGALLVADEIWTGLGRSGAMLASLAETTPDIVCLGKALGAGLPISACVGSSRVMEAWSAYGGTAIHTATHFGSPLACAAATAVLHVLRTDALPARANDVGTRFREALESRLAGLARVRGRGLMIGIELRDASQALFVSRSLLARGYLVLTGGSRGDTLTLTPPLTIADPLLDGFASALAECVSAS